MQIKGQLFNIKKKSIFESFHSDFRLFVIEKSNLVFGSITLIIPPKFDFTILFESFLLKLIVKAFCPKSNSLYIDPNNTIPTAPQSNLL